MTRWARYKLALGVGVPTFFVICDRLTKELARAHLEGQPPHEAIAVFPDWVYIHWVTNDAGQLGTFSGFGAASNWMSFVAVDELGDPSASG